MDPSRTLWLGNLQKGITEEEIHSIFNEISKPNYYKNFNIDVNILNISIYFKDDNNKGSAFLEFETPEIAKKILKEYNKKTIKGHLLKLNWTNLNQKNYNMRYSNNPQKNKYNDNTKENKVLYTVRN